MKPPPAERPEVSGVPERAGVTRWGTVQRAQWEGLGTEGGMERRVKEKQIQSTTWGWERTEVWGLGGLTWSFDFRTCE